MPKSDLIDFTLFDTNKFYLSNGDPSGVKGLINMYFIFSHNIQMMFQVTTVVFVLCWVLYLVCPKMNKPKQHFSKTVQTFPSL